MDVNVLAEYLVKLGFAVNNPAMTRFNNALKDAGAQVERATSGITKAFVGAGVAVTGALASIATATIALADHVAEADLGYQLFAQRMYMSTDAARAMKIATDALGHSLDEIAWNPELRERYFQLLTDQRVMGGQLGGDYEAEMRKVRDLRFEFTRLQVAITYLGMAVTKSLSKALFGDGDALLVKLQKWNEWLEQNLSRVGDKIATYLVPVLRDMKAVLLDVVDIFMKLTGAIFNDEKLRTGALSIDNVGLAVDHVADATRRVFDYLDKVATLISQYPVLTKMLTGAAGGAIIGAKVGGPEGAAYGALAGAGAGLGWGLNDKFGGPLSAQDAYRLRTIKDYIAARATEAGLDPLIALAVAQRESGFNPNARGSKGELGLFQLMPGTASALGVDPSNPIQNVAGGLKLLNHLFGKYHDWTKALEAYNAGERAVDTGHVPLMSQTYAEGVLKNRMAFGGAAQPSVSITTHVGDIHIHAQPGQSPHDIAQETKRVLREHQTVETKRKISQVSAVYAQ